MSAWLIEVAQAIDAAAYACRSVIYFVLAMLVVISFFNSYGRRR